MRNQRRIAGTVRPRGPQQWMVRLSAGIDPLSGKRRQPSRVVSGTRADAEQALIEMQFEAIHGQVGSASMTVDQLFNRWIDSPTKGGRLRSATTRYHDSGRYRRYVQPALGGRQLGSLRPRDLSLLYDALLTRALPGRKSPISPQSVHLVHSMLRAMFNWAWRRDLVPENPALKADAPSVLLAPLVAPERSLVLAHLERLWVANQDLATIVWLAASLGLRRSEVVALRWSDVCFRDNCIDIRRGVVKVPGQEIRETTTKTGLHGHARLPLHEETLRLLSKRYTSFRKQQAAVGISVEIDGYVFSSGPESQIPLNPDAVSKSLRLHCMRNPDLQSITIQALRKYAASDLVGTGVDETTASALLRNRPETARRHYQAANRRILLKQALAIADRLVEGVA